MKPPIEFRPKKRAPRKTTTLIDNPEMARTLGALPSNLSAKQEVDLRKYYAAVAKTRERVRRHRAAKKAQKP